MGSTSEVDISHSSTDKFAFYATLGVPEIWRYDGRRAQIYHLMGQSYVESPASRAFPVLTVDVLLEFLQQGKTVSQSAVLRSFRQWLQKQKRPNP